MVLRQLEKSALNSLHHGSVKSYTSRLLSQLLLPKNLAVLGMTKLVLSRVENK